MFKFKFISDGLDMVPHKTLMVFDPSEGLCKEPLRPVNAGRLSGTREVELKPLFERP